MSEPTEYPIDLPVTPKMADRMRAAGWRPPARVITTRAELNALPDGALIWFMDDGERVIVERANGGYWYRGEVHVPLILIDLPATVLWEPSE